MVSAWIQFRRDHKGEHMTMQQLSDLYQKTKVQHKLLKSAKPKVAPTHKPKAKGVRVPKKSEAKMKERKDEKADEIFSPEIQTVIRNTPHMAEDFTSTRSHEEQLLAHEKAEFFLRAHLHKIGSSFELFAPYMEAGTMTNTNVGQLDSSVFTWEHTDGVQGDIQRDGEDDGHGDGDGDAGPDQEVPGETLFVYGAASQFNGSEAPTEKETLKPGTAVELYKKDKTQGPQAQLQFSKQQVELINCAANIGFNTLVKVLNESTKDAVKNGYLMLSKSQIDEVIARLRSRYFEMDFIAVKSKPVDYTVSPPKVKAKKVHLLLGAAPAFGRYAKRPLATTAQAEQLQYLCAFYSFSAQFEYVDFYAQREKVVVFKPAATGLGVFENNPLVVAKAFYDVAKEYENSFLNRGVQVRFQVYMGRKGGKAFELVQHLKLKQYHEHF